VKTTENKHPSSGLLLGAFFLSGAAGLIYQVVWMRRLVTMLGVTSHAVGVALSVYMAGLAIGAWLFSKGRVSRVAPLRLYTFLELGVAVSGLATIALLDLTPKLYAHVAAGMADESPMLLVIRVLAAAACLIVPTILMGGTLPALSRAVANDPKGGTGEVARLYSANTFGAVVGTAATAMYLIFHYGLNGSTLIAAGLNVIAALLVLPLRTSTTAESGNAANSTTVVRSQADGGNTEAQSSKFTVALFVAGFVSLAFEVVWTRYLIFVLHANSVYAFASMLAAFLTGIALGSELVAKRLKSRKRRGSSDSTIPLCFYYAAVSSLLSAPIMAWLVQTPSGGGEFAVANLVMYLKCVLVLIIPTALSGAVFVLIIDRISSSNTLGADVGRAYTINTVGCIFGALAGSFVFLPLLGVHQAIFTLSFIYLIAAIVTKPPGAWTNPLQFISAVLALAVAGVINGMSGDPFLLHHLRPNDKLLFYKSGAESSIALVEAGPGAYNFIVDSDVQASTAPGGALSLRLMGHLPALIHPAPKRALIICLGTGISAASLLMHPIEHLDIVELSPHVPQIQDLLKDFNHGAIHDPRVRLIRDDGRNFLLRSKEKYDIISTDPLDPDDAGNTLLYSAEFYQLIKEHLNEGGIVAQWLPPISTSFGPLGAYRSHIRTFSHAFKNSSIWEAHFSSVIVGLSTPVQVNIGEFERRYNERNLAPDLARSEIYSYERFKNLFIIGPDKIPAFVGDGPLISDTFPFVEYLTLRDQGAVKIEDPFDTIKAMRDATPRSFIPE
jgi:spermidine synthase